MTQTILLLELNEVPFRILDEHARRHPDSWLARILPASSQFTSVAEDSTGLIPHGTLSPWITWPTVHRGVLYDQHGITHFGQDLSAVDERFPPVWKLLAGRGVATGVFGSLHSWPPPPDVERYAFFVPDTFASGPATHPRSLEPFQAFNLAMAKDSPRNVSAGIHWGPALAFLARAPFLGLRASTALDVARQLVEERRNPAVRTRRRTYQTVLAFDLWMKLVERRRPAFATFFSNHVASAMHRFWAAAFPEDYDEPVADAAWIATYRDEIGFAMSRLDAWLGRLVRFVGAEPGRRLVIASSMGQAATRAELLETQLYARDVERLMAALGLAAGEWSRHQAMDPDVNVEVAPEAADRFEAALRGLRIAGRPARYDRRGEGFFSLVFGQHNLAADAAVEVAGRPATLAELGLRNVEIEDRAGSTAYHVPEGILVVYDPAQASPDATRAKVSTVELAPWLLGRFGVPVPDYMRSTGTLERALD